MEPRVPKAAGMNRFVWNLRHASARAVPGDVLTERSLSGPVVPPGRYQVELVVGDRTLTAPLEVRRDPAVKASQADLEAACAFLLRVRDALSEVHDAVNAVRDARRQVEDWMRRTSGHASAGEIAGAGRPLVERLNALEQDLIEPRIRADGDRLHYPTRLNAKLAGISSVVATADAAPTRQVQDVFAEVSAEARRVLGRWRELARTEVPAFAALLRRLDVPAVVV
jgi:hypothetical protein